MIKKYLLSALVACASLTATALPTIEESFYVSIGSCTPLKKNCNYSRTERSFQSIGLGSRVFVKDEFGADVGCTLHLHPFVHCVEVSVKALYKPRCLKGVYFGAGPHSLHTMTAYLEKEDSFGVCSALGYEHMSPTFKRSFIEFGLDNDLYLSLKSGLMF